MVEVRKITWRRTVLPENASFPLTIDLLLGADGAEKAAGAAVWARVQKKYGNKTITVHSEIVMYWAHNTELSLRRFVFN